MVRLTKKIYRKKVCKMANLFPSNRPFDDFEKRFFGNMFPTLFDSARQMSVDVEEKDDRYEVDADIPGFDKEDIHVEYADESQRLTIKANKETSHEEKDEERNYLHRERSSHTFHRQFTLSNVDSENVTAKYENGVLHLTLPKKENGKENKKQISID